MTAASLEGWPDLSGLTLKPTLDTLHLWSQVVGKIRTMLTPWESHGWHLPLYVTSRGLDIGLITGATLALSIDFELISEALVIRTTDGRQVDIELAPRSVASFYAEALAALARVGVEVAIDPMPNEIPDALPFHRDKLVWAYDGEMAHAYWSTLVQVRRVVQRFRTRFVGRSSPILLQSTYEAATDLGHWDRPALERVEGSLGHPPAI